MISAAVAFALGYFLAPKGTEKVLPPTVESFIWPPLKLEPFELLRTTNVTFDENNLDHHWTLLFFVILHDQ